MLNLLINVIKRNQSQIPDNTGRLVRTFFHYLLTREESKNENFKKDELLFLLNKLAYKTRIEEKVSFSKDTILQVFSKEKSKLGLDFNLIDTIDKLVEINILDTNKNLFHFSHELFQEYFMAEELVDSVLDGKINYEQFVNTPYLNEPLFFCGGLLSEMQQELFYKGINQISSTIAAKAYINSSNNEKAKQFIINSAIDRSSNIQDINSTSDGLAALSILDEKEYFIQIISKILNETQNYKNLHNVFRNFVRSMEQEEIEVFLHNALAIRNSHISLWILQFLAKGIITLSEVSFNKFINNHIDYYIEIIEANIKKNNSQLLKLLQYVIASNAITIQIDEEKTIHLLIEHGLKFSSSIPTSILLIKKNNLLHKFDKLYLFNLVLSKCTKYELYSILDLDLTNEPKIIYTCIFLLEKKWTSNNYLLLSIAIELLLNYKYGYDSYLISLLEKLISSESGYIEYLKLKSKYPKLNGAFSDIEIIDIILSKAQTISGIKVAEQLIAKNNLEHIYPKLDIAKKIIFNTDSHQTFISGIKYIELYKLEEKIQLQDILEFVFSDSNAYNHRRNFRIIAIIKILTKTYNVTLENIINYFENIKYPAIIKKQENDWCFFELSAFKEFGKWKIKNGKINEKIFVKFKALNQKNNKVYFQLAK